MPRALRTLRLSFRETHLTHFGGMMLLQRFCNKLGLRRLLQQSLRISQRNADYHPCDLVLALLYIIMAGLRRINKTEILQYNGTFLSLLGLPRFPDQSTLRRFLKRMSTRSVRQLVSLHDQLRAQLFPLPRRRTTLTFDLDSVVLTVYGQQQFARIGYNPKKHGRRSYHPLICFEAHLQEFWHGSLRPGNAVTATGWWPLSNAVWTKCPPPWAGPESASGPILGASASGLWNSSIHVGVATPCWPSSTPLSREAPAVANSASCARGGRWESSVINPTAGSVRTALWWSVV